MSVKLEIEEYVTSSMREDIIQWKGEGKTNRWIANEIGVSLSLLNKWKRLNPWFDEIFKKGKLELRENLESAIYKRALGFKITTTEIEESDMGCKTKIKETFIQSDAALFRALAHVDRKNWSKETLDTNGTNDDIGEKQIVFGGEDDL